MAAGRLAAYSTGRKQYGAGRLGPNQGTVQNTTGYAERDRKMAARREAMTKRLKLGQRRVF